MQRALHLRVQADASVLDLLARSARRAGAAVAATAAADHIISVLSIISRCCPSSRAVLSISLRLLSTFFAPYT
jgi:hypothetical protein